MSLSASDEQLSEGFVTRRDWVAITLLENVTMNLTFITYILQLITGWRMGQTCQLQFIGLPEAFRSTISLLKAYMLFKTKDYRV